MAEASSTLDVALALPYVERFIELIPVPVTVLTAEGMSLLENRPYLDALGLTRETVRSRTIEQALHADDVVKAKRIIDAALREGSGSDYLRLRHNDGRFLTFHWDLLFDPNAGWIIGIASDRTLERRRLAQAQHQARTDSLTGVLSRAGLMENLGERSQVQQDARLVVTMFDVDGFKDVNDNLGHQVGDHVLREIARRVSHTVPRGATVGRLGGDEFLVVASEREATAEAMISAVRSVFDMPFEHAGRKISVGASIGVCVSSPVDSVDMLLRNADIAVYEAKRNGGRRASVATDELVSRWEEQRRVEHELRMALGTGQFVPHFQPIVDVATRRTETHEVLLRWQQPDGSVTPAGAFLGTAENAGLLPAMSAEVRTAAIAAAGQVSGLELAINISAAELLGADLGPELANLVRRHDVDPAHVTIEVTEQTALRDTDRAARVLGRLREIGFRIALDDFGSGYSSLTYLTQLPIDVVKLDRHFVRAAANRSRAPAVPGDDRLSASDRTRDRRRGGGDPGGSRSDRRARRRPRPGVVLRSSRTGSGLTVSSS